MEVEIGTSESFIRFFEAVFSIRNWDDCGDVEYTEEKNSLNRTALTKDSVAARVVQCIVAVISEEELNDLRTLKQP